MSPATRPALLALAALAALAATPARADFASCKAALRAEAPARGVSTSTFDAAMAGVAPDPKVLELMDQQPEVKTPIWDYLATLTDDEKARDGQAKLREHAALLSRVEQAYGVDRHAIVAVWGVESDFGKAMGKWPLVQALSTVSCEGRRQAFFRGEFFATLKIIERGDLGIEKLRGSWAGAFGHTQFMPSTYLRLAVDGDGDGRRDLVDSIPDVLASTANYLKRAGWVSGASWGYEVRLPAGYAGPSGRTNRQAFASWQGRGLTKVGGGALSGAGNAALLLPAGIGGPAFLVFKNFDAAYSYNAAESYALAISLLTDRLKGRGGEVVAPWPTDDRGLTRAERRELMALLGQRGYDVGVPDGAIGAKTRAAIKDVEKRLGRKETGRPGGAVFEALKGS